MITKTLKGKCVWINDDLAYNDSIIKEYEHTVARIENVTIEDHAIQFIIPNPGYLPKSYNITLLRDDIGTKYQSYSSDLNISCETFVNETHYIIYGKWNEDGETYTWWAITDFKS